MAEPIPTAISPQVSWDPAITPVEIRIEHFSHEFRTTVTSIQAALGLLQFTSWEQLPESSQRLLTIALNNSDRIIQLLELLKQEQLTRTAEHRGEGEGM